MNPRTSNDVTVTWPLGNVALLEHADPGALRMDTSTNTYLLVNAARKALLVDGSFDYLVPPLRSVLQSGYELVGLALTHRHLAGHDGVRHLADAFDVPVFLHPIDVKALHASAPGLTFENPAGSAVLAAFDLETVFFPGHTEGHVMYYRDADGLLITGDAAVGTTHSETARGVQRLLRPPLSFNTDDTQLRQGWASFDRPVRHVLPFHGALITGREPSEMKALMQSLQRQEPS